MSERVNRSSISLTKFLSAQMLSLLLANTLARRYHHPLFSSFHRMTNESHREANDALPIVRLHDVDCRILLQRYELGNRVRLQLIAIDDDLPYACATVNDPSVPLSENELLIKNWSENEGVLQALVDAYVVEDTGRTVPMGRTRAHIVRLLLPHD